MTISEVTSRLSSLVETVSSRESRVIIEKDALPVAVLISIEDLQRLIALDQEQARRLATIERMRDAFADVPPEQIEQDVVDIIRELRNKDEEALRAEAETVVERRPA